MLMDAIEKQNQLRKLLRTKKNSVQKNKNQILQKKNPKRIKDLSQPRLAFQTHDPDPEAEIIS